MEKDHASIRLKIPKGGNYEGNNHSRRGKRKYNKIDYNENGKGIGTKEEEVAVEGLYKLGKTAQGRTKNLSRNMEVFDGCSNENESMTTIQKEDRNIKLIKLWARTKLFRSAKFLTTKSLKSDGNIAKMAMKQIGLKIGTYNDVWCDNYRNIVRKNVNQRRSNVDQDVRISFKSK